MKMRATTTSMVRLVTVFSLRPVWPVSLLMTHSPVDEDKTAAPGRAPPKARRSPARYFATKPAFSIRSLWVASALVSQAA